MGQDLVAELLKHIPDDVTMSDMSLTYGSTLVTNINLALSDETINLPRLSLTSNGKEVKDALGKLDPKTQVSILYNIVVHKRDDEQRNTPDETKNFKIKFSKLVTVSFFIIGIILLILILKAYLTNGKLPDTSLLIATFAVVTGMVKILISGD